MTDATHCDPWEHIAKKELLFFLHIPRTAGTTLNHVLADNFSSENILPAYDRAGLAAMEAMTPAELARVRLIQGHVLIRDFAALVAPIRRASREPVALAPFTFVREPVARVISEYRFLKTWQGQHMYDVLNRDGIGLAEYVTSERKDLRWRGKNLMTRLLSGMDFGFAPSGPDVDAALEVAKENLEKKFAFVGVTERFDESVLLLRKRFGLKFPFYVRRNTLANKQKFEVSDETRQKIREHNQADAELHQFACRLLDARAAEAGAKLAEEMRTLSFVNSRYQKLADLMAKTGGGAPPPVMHLKNPDMLAYK